ncbi:flagellar hook-basal body protein FliE [Novosphingobium barchaimii LL02]|uniref:Flagellar hook-basal body complex protein FliE n=1 Tax=Novosphingobium barchaimii LL02 TaxID=1114963 RepID=A0A0J7XNJ3_9SPHN|nr:flagellar hook-basal body complex protein FliE [Novosphingobium barchaimii]KMS52663.1 flagellar hook-basal body protein FliE [Novosphingobium barchaimii LL02]
MSIGALDAASAYGRAMRAASPLSGGTQGAAGLGAASLGAGSATGGSAGLTSIGPGLAPGIGGLGGTLGAQTGGSSFGGMIESMVSETAGSLRNAETQSVKQIGGKGDLIDVVTAIGAAETALDTVVAVRDRVVSAYSDIMRMQI